jgi:RimJ/RimL family protein N-acetyltransferase
MPVIDTARQRQRTFTLDDADAYYQAERMLRFFSEYWDMHRMGGLAIIHKADDKLIGQCGLHSI